MGSYKEHQNIIKKFTILAQKELKGIRVFDRHVGKFVSMRFFKDLLSKKCQFSDWKKYIIAINQSGMADCYALLPTKYGLIHIEIECKSGQSKQSSDQKTWQKYIEKNNGIYIILRNEYDSISELKLKLGSPIN